MLRLPKVFTDSFQIIDVLKQPQDTNSGNIVVVVKKLTSFESFFNESSNMFWDPNCPEKTIFKFVESKAEFNAEVSALMICVGKGIPQIFACGGFKIDDKDIFFIQLESIEGKSLIAPNKSEIYDIFKQICQILKRIHADKIVHNDLKEQHLIWNEGKVTLIDFGLSENLVYKESPFEWSGSWSYIAPERIPSYGEEGEETLTKKKKTTKSDVWSMGIILLGWISGRSPRELIPSYDLKSQLKLSYELVGKLPCLKKNSGDQWDEDLFVIAQSMLTIDPQKRPSFAQILTLLKSKKTNL